MKFKDRIEILLIVLAIVFLWLFLDEREIGKRKDKLIKKLRKQNNQLKVEYLSLLEQYLKSQNSVEPSVITELQKLKAQINNLDSATHIELDSVIKRVNENEGSKAVKDLAKIVENKLKEKVKDDARFKGNPMLGNLLNHAFKCNWINDRIFNNGLLLRDIRNKESHELAVNIPALELGLAIFTGVEIIYRLGENRMSSN